MKRQHTHINRDNYEVWFIDHLDGQLSATENAMLQTFLAQNTDLAMELESLAEITLEAPARKDFPNKILLKKASAPFSDLSVYDYQMVKALEEGLQTPEHVNMSTYSAQADRDLYQKTRLKAASLAYPLKNKLKRKRLAFMPVALRAVAAAIVVIILFNVKDEMPLQDYDNNNLVATTETLPVIEPTPVLTQTETIFMEAPESVNAPAYSASATEIFTAETLQEPATESAVDMPAALSGPKVSTLPTPHLPNSYETGLRLMLPKYVENHQLMASLSNQVLPRMAEPDTKTLLNRTTDLLKQVTPFNLTYNKVYDEEGELVAINVSGDNFEVAQRVPRWLGAK